MDKTAIKNFAVWGRNKLIADCVYKASLLGITEQGIAAPLPQSAADVQLFAIGMKEPYAITGQAISQRKKLVEAIEEKQKDLGYEEAFQSVMEEATYTWFNRLIAIRFMEVNDYLPSHVRVLSSDNPAKTEPDLVTAPFDADFSFSEKEKQQIIRLKNENKMDDLFRLLFLKQCNALNESLPLLFEKISDYTELLLNLSITDREGIVWHLVHDIPEDNFDVQAIGEDGQPIGQVEIIGWLYQYYNIEPKSKIDANVKKGIKVSKYEMPAKTQLFTPDWIVRYLVENSLGRMWIDGHPNDELKSNWKYYLDEEKQEEDVQKQLDQIYAEHARLKPEDITCMDPCCGSGHILVYMFDVLEQIYQSQGYSAREASASIVEHNIFGLDIDKRAAQLAYFAVMMKARQYDRRFLTRGIQPNVYVISDNNNISEDCLLYFANGNETINSEIHMIVHELQYGGTLGSLLQIQKCDFNTIHQRLKTIDNEINLYKQEVYDYLVPMLRVAMILSQQYHVIVTNPPYLGNGEMNGILSSFIQNNYKSEKTDIYAAFIKRCSTFLHRYGYQAMITMQSWMNLGAFAEMRKSVCTSKDIVTMWHLDDMLLGIAYQTVAFVLRSSRINGYEGIYFTASKKDYANCYNKMYKILDNCGYSSQQDLFLTLAGCPIAYSLGDSFINAYNSSNRMSEIIDTREGMTTGNNDRFLRYWFEINSSKINYKWLPYSKGGDYRKWYGNNEYVVNWENDGEEIKKFRDRDTGRVRSHNYNGKYALKKGITWSAFSSRGATFRYSDDNCLFDSKGSKAFCDDELIIYILAFLNSCVANKYLQYFSGAKDTKPGHLLMLPFKIDYNLKMRIDTLANKCISIEKNDWDGKEISVDFNKKNIINGSYTTLEQEFSAFKENKNTEFSLIKTNEENINKLFIDIFNVSDEIDPAISDKDITLFELNKNIFAKQIISYAVGCMFGRYSLDVYGLAYAGGEWDDSKYKTFIPDADNVIPVTDEEYLDDDIVGSFVKFVKFVYGEKTLEENLTFIAEALGGKGKSSREVIRNYFLKDFFKDHCKMYQKRPIYWLYDSGKQNGFKALVYLHRMDENTTGRVRADYLHRMEQIYTGEIARMQDTIDHSQSAHEVSVAEKRLEKLKKQVKECQDYDAKLGHLALDQIKLDLDDGVKVNYRKAQTGRDGKFYEVLADSKNIMAKDALWKEYLTEWPHEED